jgi:Epoxide hydrolase N terminus
MSTTVETTTEIRPFHAEIPQAEIDDLRRRLATTRTPDKETVGDVDEVDVQSVDLGESSAPAR